MLTANEFIADYSLGHQVDLQLYANGVVRRMVALLNRTDGDLLAALEAAGSRVATDWTVERLESLLTSVRALNAQAYAALGAAMEKELAGLVSYELGFQLQLFTAAIPPQVVASAGIAQVVAQQVFSAAMSRPFQGRLLREWAKSLDVGRMARVRDAVRTGFVEQQSIGEIVKRVRGTRAKQYSDGIIAIDRRHAETVVRTAIAHTAAHSAESFFVQNDDLVKGLTWSATLDLRTSEICRPRDGKVYALKPPHKPIGHDQKWLSGPGRSHFNCRSRSLPVLKSWKELGGVDYPSFSPSTRASMDGQVAPELTYGTWLRKQSGPRQDEVLGRERGRFFRAGLAIEEFTNNRGQLLTLDQLRARNASAFSKANQ